MEKGEELTREVGYVPVSPEAYVSNLTMVKNGSN